MRNKKVSFLRDHSMAEQEFDWGYLLIRFLRKCLQKKNSREIT